MDGDWLEARILAFAVHICTTALRGRWSDGQLALLFSIALLFTARGMSVGRVLLTPPMSAPCDLACSCQMARSSHQHMSCTLSCQSTRYATV
jgi:hypothetical protein